VRTDVIMDQETGRSRGFGTCVFATVSAHSLVAGDAQPAHSTQLDEPPCGRHGAHGIGKSPLSPREGGRFCLIGGARAAHVACGSHWHTYVISRRTPKPQSKCSKTRSSTAAPSTSTCGPKTARAVVAAVVAVRDLPPLSVALGVIPRELQGSAS
jgi:hypothetical protein